MEKYSKNGINILLEKSPKTPRGCVNLFFKVNKIEKFFGINSLLARLLLQGTKKYSASDLAKEFENECIDISTKAKQDYIKIGLVFLNEDFHKAMDLAKELLLNSTFDDFEKEIFKLKGEIVSELDNPRIKLTDAYIKNIYKNHPYSSSYTKILENLDKIQKKDVIEAHKIMLDSLSAVVYVGDYSDKEEILNYFSDQFGFLKSKEQIDEIPCIFNNKIEKDELVWLTKNDAAQAQILQGWLIDSFNSPNCAKISVLNNILGSSGLSSRLFVNLRDKQGLAYTVRSQYETFLKSGLFSMYIGTTPENIQKSLEGFRIELQKLADEAPSGEELRGAKENISGRMKYFSQNNSQIAAVRGYDFTMGLGLNYSELFMDDINSVSAKDVSCVARWLLSMPKLIAIIAPDKYKIEL